MISLKSVADLISGDLFGIRVYPWKIYIPASPSTHLAFCFRGTAESKDSKGINPLQKLPAGFNELCGSCEVTQHVSKMYHFTVIIHPVLSAPPPIFSEALHRTQSCLDTFTPTEEARKHFHQPRIIFPFSL